MPKRLLATALLAVLLLPFPAVGKSRHATPAPATGSGQVAQYDTESAAQSHCRSDIVVWLNTNSGIYHEKGMRWYGRTKHGAYVCQKQADAAGDRDTKNGQ